jgi:leader peptidase (prepilin peptidase)/N-methyltransferase
VELALTNLSMLLLAAVVAGLVFGSFLNVCIVRLPQHRSVAHPRSQCVACGQQIAAWDNIPVLSWLLLRGRCRHCRARISLQYPLVELATAILFLACVLRFGAQWQTLVAAVACFLLLGLAVMDAQTMLLPDTFTMSGIALAIALRAFAPEAHPRWVAALVALRDAAVAAAVLLLVWGLYWLVRRRHGLGFGDVKLLAMIAAFLGIADTAFALFAGVVAAAMFALVLLAAQRANRATPLPFGTFLCGGAIAAIFAGHPVIAWYLRFFH